MDPHHISWREILLHLIMEADVTIMDFFFYLERIWTWFRGGKSECQTHQSSSS
jgi:hypothetical protein